MTAVPNGSDGSVRLYCVPHAGATASMFRDWQAVAPEGVEIVGIDQPGQGTRSREQRVTDLDGLLEAITRFALADLGRAGAAHPGVRWATFGHSFGAVPALELAAALQRATGRPPAAVVLSAALPPGLQPPGDAAADLSDDELLNRIRRDGGTSAALLDVPAMAAHILRAMRADHAIRREFPTRAGLRVGFPLTLVAAQDDRYVSPEQMWRWAEHTTASCQRIELAGDHFTAVRDPVGLAAFLSTFEAGTSTGEED